MFEKNEQTIEEVNFFRAIVRPGFVKFLIAFAMILLLALTLYWYFAVYSEKNEDLVAYEEYLELTKQNLAIVRADTYGGKTPQETLDLFIKALDIGDPELAAMYFELDENGSREKWRQVMHDTYNAGRFSMIVEILKKAIPEPEGIIGDSFYAFSVRGENGDVIADVGLVFNGYLWKIKRV